MRQLEKAPTGIKGLDEITYGGLPRGRTALICGGPGSGKTVFAMEFLVRGATQYGEPGVFLSFEESSDELTKNVASLGFDLKKLEAENKLRIEHVRIERSEIEETGEYDLEGLFIRIAFAVDKIGAKRIVLDTLEALFGTLKETSILRAEIRRLFRFLKEKGLTAVVTAEQGPDGRLTRNSLEEYVSDCVIQLDNRVTEQVSTRRFRVLKYRGSLHGTNEYPFLIDQDGIFIVPVTSLELEHIVTTERISTGIPKLDSMLGGKGYYRGTTILITGTAGTGKTTLTASFAEAACKRGEKILYFSFEESPNQIIRNMRSVGIDLEPWVKEGYLKFSATRPSYYGLEKHLAYILKLVFTFKPTAVIFDPMSDLVNIGSAMEVRLMLARLIDSLKMNGITALLTSLTATFLQDQGDRDVVISSLIDTWILLREIESNGERNRGIHILKSRGMHHSNQIRELILTSQGVDLIDVYVGPEGVLTGSSRLQQESHDRAEMALRQAEIQARQTEMERRRNAFEMETRERRAALEAEEANLKRSAQHIGEREKLREVTRESLGTARTNENIFPPPKDASTQLSNLPKKGATK